MEGSEDKRMLGYLDLLVKALERVGALALVAYILIVWMPEQNRKIDQVSMAQAQQAVVLERVVQILERIDRSNLGRP
ncbi:hypothetical protein [Meiothermus cerbereus]|uniref:hypothetical protein n=1 Tax=Meiothermus cerbereus TaxID=65552 RepID=UPI003EEC6169